MIHVEGLTKRYGERVLLDDVSWHVKKRDRIGLSGPNGAGKTTLLKMLAGFEEPDEGSIRMASDTTIGYLPQDGIVHHGRTVYDEVVLAFTELLALKEEQHQIEEKLTDVDPAESERLLVRYAEVTERFKDRGGWEIEARVAEVLKGLGFTLEDQQRPTQEFSGGWQMRIALAKLLLARPNLLLMDEPTNHLDLPARNWLEEYLHDYPGSVVLVSHDRYFLDATVLRITEVGLRTLTDYHGNYSKYVVEHAANMERLRESHRRQSEEIEKAEAFISRFRYQATKARQVQSRIKQLDKVERIEIPPARKKIRFKFPDAPKPGRVVLELKGVQRAYGDKVVLKKVDFLVEKNERIALVGANGAGKSTLMRLLAGVDQPTEGVRLSGHQVVIDYFAQDQAAVLNPTRTVYEEMTQASSTTMVPMIRNLLGGFLFSGDDIYKRVSVLSGGERNRLALAKMLLNPSNVLLLDEPTNHLDLDSKEVLLEALDDYGGTLIFVSHDRYFVDRLANKVVDVGGGEAMVYPGGYEDFIAWKKAREAGVAAPLPTRDRKPVVHLKEDAAPAARTFAKPSAAPAQPSPKQKDGGAKKANAPAAAPAAAAPSYDPLAPRLRPPSSPADRQAREREAQKARKRSAELEKKIAEKEQQVRDVETLMASPGFYDDRAAAEKAVEDRKRLLGEVEVLMADWEAAQAAAEMKA
ncbi:MAG: ABC-F family ATP-binding cassette domain-containing protein [Vicinamibacteria bacterium]